VQGASCMRSASVLICSSVAFNGIGKVLIILPPRLLPKLFFL
jgi:hypothetical protein